MHHRGGRAHWTLLRMAQAAMTLEQLGREWTLRPVPSFAVCVAINAILVVRGVKAHYYGPKHDGGGSVVALRLWCMARLHRYRYCLR